MDQGDLNSVSLSCLALSVAIDHCYGSGPFLPHSSLSMAGPLVSQLLTALLDVATACGDSRVTDTASLTRCEDPLYTKDGLAVSEWDTWYPSEDKYL